MHVMCRRSISRHINNTRKRRKLKEGLFTIELPMCGSEESTKMCPHSKHGHVMFAAAVALTMIERITHAIIARTAAASSGRIKSKVAGMATDLQSFQHFPLFGPQSGQLKADRNGLAKKFLCWTSQHYRARRTKSAVPLSGIVEARRV